MKFFIIGILGIFLSATGTFAADCTEKLSWLPNPESNIKGYTIYYGQTDGGPYPNTLAVGNPLPVDGRIQGEVPGLICAQKYYVVCTAVSDAGLESSFSNQIDLITTGIPTPTGFRLVN